MKTWKAVSWGGQTDFFSAYTETEARQEAESFCQHSGGVKEWSLVL